MPHDVQTTLICAAGFACILATGWMGEVAHDTAAASLPSWVTWAADLLNIVLLIVVAVFSTRIREAFEGMGVRVAAIAAVASLAGRVAVTVPGSSALPDVVVMLAHLLYTLAETVLLLEWFVILCGEASRDVPVSVPVAYAAVAGLSLVMRLLPPVVASVAVVTFPTISAALMIVMLRGGFGTRPAVDALSAPAEDDVDAPVTTDSVTTDSAPSASSPAVGENPSPRGWSFPVRPVVLMTAFEFAFSFSLALSLGPNPYGPVGMLVVAGLALVVALLVKSGSYSPAFLYKLALPLMVAGLISLAFLTVARTVAVMFTNSANVAFTIFMTIALCPMCYRYAIEPLWVFGIVQACSRIAMLVGRPVGSAFVDAFPVGSETNGVVVCVVVVALVALSIVFFNDQLADKSFGLSPTAASGAAATGPEAVMTYNERVVWRCSQVARTYGLTQREQEVLELMAQGLSAADIAEKICVSYGTVKTHVNHVYKKLDVHSRDEAMALVTGA